MKLNLTTALALMATTTISGACAQEGLAEDLTRILASDGMQVVLSPATTSNGTQVVQSANASVPGRMRSDGWFEPPGIVGIGKIVLLEEGLQLPQLSLPIRRTDLQLGKILVEGFAPRAGGILSQTVEGIVVAPVTMTKAEGAFVSADRLIVSTDVDGSCFVVDLEGLAISVENTLPALSSTSEPYYKGKGRLEFDCTGDTWTARTFTMDADGWGSLVADLDISFSPQTLLSLVVAERKRIDGLFAENAEVDAILEAENEMWFKIADEVSLGRASLVFTDAGFARSVSDALPDVAGIPGAQDVLIRTLIARIGADYVVDTVAPALADFLEEPNSISLTLAPPAGSTMGSLASGEVPATAWSARVE